MTTNESTASPILARRAAGVLLHPTSLPGPWGIGDLGPEAHSFVDFLYATGQQLWEVLPMGPTGYGDSPYQGLSAFAGNPNLLSPDRLAEDGLLDPAELAALPRFPEGRVDFGAVIPFKRQLLTRAYDRFRAGARPELIAALHDFRAQESDWLENFALFAALKEAHGGSEWRAWEDELARRDPAALDRARNDLRAQIDFQVFAQFLFFRQWLALKRYANDRGVQIVGDIPIFMGYDSADVWANQEIFYLDPDARMTVVAAAAPDFFIATGQLWGNPLYRWDVLKERGYDWWVARFRMALEQADILRLDHFRGFAAYWEVEAGAENAVNGRWAPGPGADLFEVASHALGPLPLIAEDLGLITEDVHALRARLGYPGMKVLVEAFHGGADNIYLPHNYTHDFVVYPGTHDMQTVRGWWANLAPRVQEHARRYMRVDGHDIAWDLIHQAFASVADMAIIQMQDLLDLDNSARMNTPGTAEGNWTWRYQREQIDRHLIERLRLMTSLYGRDRPVAEKKATEAAAPAASDPTQPDHQPPTTNH